MAWVGRERTGGFEAGSTEKLGLGLTGRCGSDRSKPAATTLPGRSQSLKFHDDRQQRFGDIVRIGDRPAEGRRGDRCSSTGHPRTSAVQIPRFLTQARGKEAECGPPPSDPTPPACNRVCDKSEFLRLYDLRHAFAVASLVDDPDSIYRHSEHLGHTLVSTTEIYTGHIRRDEAMWRYSREPMLFGSLATPAHPTPDGGSHTGPNRGRSAQQPKNRYRL